jgi:diacylglycerol kinase (ATP)
MKTCFIINPCSGRNRRRPWLVRAIRDFVSARSLDAGVAVTEGPRHATELARTAVQRGCAIVVAVGGDGTMNEVAQALTNTPTALALVPCGSGNGLALHLGLSRTLFGALQLLDGTTAGGIAAIDTGAVDDRPFFNAMGFGFDAEVSRRFNGLTRRGLPAYVRATIGVLRSVRSERCTIVAGSRRETLETVLVAVANSDQYGNNARIAPGARVNDGELDLIAVRPTGVWGLAGLVPRLFLGTIDRSAHVMRLRGSCFTIERTAPGIVHADGETHEAGATIVVRVNPRNLRVVVPAKSKLCGAADLSPTAGSFALELP